MATPLDDFLGGGVSVKQYQPPGRTAVKRPNPFSFNSRTSRSGGTMSSTTRAAAELGINRKEEEEGSNPFGALAPLADLAKGGLKVIDVARRGITLGIDELATEAFGGELGSEEEQARSNWDKLWGDEHYGVSTLLDDDLPSWLESTAGFAGDVLLDPLTYVTAGVGGVAGKAGRAGYAAKARAFGNEAIEKAVKSGADDVAVKAMQTQSDDLVRKIGRLGPGIIKDDAMLNALNLQKQGLRFGRPLSPGKGLRIGGDTAVGDALGKVAQKSNEFFAGGRAKFYDTALGGKLQDWRTPEVIAKAQRVIRSGEPEGNMGTDAALALTTYHDGVRLGEKNFTGMASPRFKQMTAKMGKNEAEAAVAMAENPKLQTEWNDWFDQLAVEAKKQGVKFDTRKNFVPHIFTPEGRAAVRGSEELAQATGTLISDLDAPSGVTMPRTWTDGKHTVDGTEIDFGTGTIAEKNAALKKITGVDKVFDDNMTSIARNYITRLGSDVGTMNGLGRASELFPELITRSDDPDAMAEILLQVTDDAATETANKDAVAKIQSRLTRAKARAGTAEREVAATVEEGRSVLAGPVAENLKRMKNLSKDGRKRLADLESAVDDLPGQRQQILEFFDTEISHMDEQLSSVRGRLAVAKYQEKQALEAVVGQKKPLLKQRAQQRATRISAQRRELEGVEETISANREMLDELERRMASDATKRRIYSRAKSEAPTPRPLPSDEGGYVQPKATVGESAAQLWGDFRPQSNLDTDFIHATPEEIQWQVFDAARADWEKAETVVRQIEDLQNAAARANDTEKLPELTRRMDDALDSVAEAKSRLGEMGLLTKDGTKLNKVKVYELTGKAERARAKQLNDADIVNRGLKKTQDGRAAPDRAVSVKMAEKKAEKAREDARRLHRSRQSAEDNQLDAVEESELLTPAKKGALTKARKSEAEARQGITEFLDSPEGAEWIDEWGLIDEKVSALNGPTRNRILEEGGFARSNADIVREIDTPGPVARELRNAKSELARINDEIAGGAAQSAGRRRNEGAAQLLNSEIKRRQEEIKKANALIKKFEDDPLMGPTKRVHGGGGKDEQVPEGIARNVGEQRGRGPAINQQREKIAKFEAEIKELQERLKSALNPTPQRTKNRGAMKAQRLAAEERVANAEFTVKEIRKRLGPKTTKFLNDRKKLMDSRSRISKLSEEAKANTYVKGTDTSHLELEATIARIDYDLEQSLKRINKADREQTYQRDLEYRRDRQGPVMDAGRVRLPATKSEIEADLKQLRTSGARVGQTDETKKLLGSRAKAFPYDKGDNSPMGITNRVIDDSVNLVPKYRNTLAHMGVITDDDMWAHNTLINEVAYYRDMFQDEARKGWTSGLVMQRMINATDHLRRSNEWMARYASVLDSGAEASDELANKVLRDVLDHDIDALTRTMADAKTDKKALMDADAEAMYDMLYEAIEDLSAAYSYKSRANTIKRTKAMSPEMKIAQLNERRERYIDTFLPGEQRGLKMHQQRRRRAIQAGDDHKLRNAERMVTHFEEQIADSKRAIQQMDDELAELHAGASTNTIQELQDVIETLDSTGAPQKLTADQVDVLEKVFDPEEVTAIKYIVENDPSQLDRMLDMFSQRLSFFDNAANDVIEIDRLPKDAVGTAALDVGSTMDDLVQGSAAMQAAKEMEDAQLTFSKIFDDMGLSRAQYLSKEKTLGYNPSTQSFSPKQLRKVIDDHLAQHRGTNSYDFMMRDLRARRARLKAINSGLGKQTQRAKTKGQLMTPAELASRNAADAPDRALRRELTRGLRKGRRETVVSPPEVEELADYLKVRNQITDTVREGRAVPPDKIRSDAVDWRTALFGEGEINRFGDGLPVVDERGRVSHDFASRIGSAPGLRARDTAPATLPQGEQKARGLLAGTTGGVARPSGAITRNSPGAKQQLLEDQLTAIAQTQKAMVNQADMPPPPNRSAFADQVRNDISAAERRAQELRTSIDDEVGTSLTPDIDAIEDRITQQYADETADDLTSLEELTTTRQAYQVGKERALAEVDADAAETVSNLRRVNEEVNGPAVNEARAMGGAETDPMLGPGVKALPPAGGTGTARASSLEGRLVEAQEAAKITQKNVTAASLSMGGAEKLADDFEKVMTDIGLGPTETAQVRSLMADAVLQDQEAARLIKNSETLEEMLDSAKRGELITVTEGLVDTAWSEMAEGLTRNAPDDLKFYMSNELAVYFTRLDSSLKDGKFWEGVRSYTNFFKTYATMRPDFHVRNALSAMFMNSTDGVPLTYNTSALKAWRAFDTYEGNYLTMLRETPDAASGVKGLTNEELADSFEVALGSGAGGQFAEKGVGPSADLSSKLYNNPLTRLSRTAGEYVEGPVRLAAAMDAIHNKGMDKYDAFARVTRLHFDYADVSKMDEYAKRIIPFWTFMSRNLPLQLTQMVGKPGWYQAWRHFEENFGTEGDPLAPDYWRSQGGIALAGRVPIISDLLGQKEGEELWLNPDFAHNRIEEDISNIADLLTWNDPGKMLTSMNPLFTTPIELATNKDLFTGQEFGEDDIEKLGGIEKILEPLLAVIGKSEDGTVDSQEIQALRGIIPTWDQMNRLIPGVVSGAEDDPSSPSAAARASERPNNRLRFGTGIPFRKLTDERRDVVARGNYYDQQDELARRQAMQRLVNG